MVDADDIALSLPLAYLITFRCYGTWLHGDPRGSMDRDHNVHGAPMIPASERLQNSERRQLRHPPVTLDARQRQVVERAVRGVCDYRNYVLRALNVRTNHVHCVVDLPLERPQTDERSLTLALPFCSSVARPRTVARPSASGSYSSVPTVARPSGSAFCRPEPLLDAFKAYATRALRQAGLISLQITPWSRHGSTIYLWTD